jgi:hypothetical protein
MWSGSAVVAAERQIARTSMDCDTLLAGFQIIAWALV